MIIDCFPFFNELDILDIRLNEHDFFVDKFIIVEALQTHRGHPKDLFFQNNKKRFSKFIDKITYLVIDFDKTNLPPTNLRLGNDITCRRDSFQKDYSRLFLLNSDYLKDDDIIFFSDLDEIFDHSKIEEVKQLVEQYEVIQCLSKHYVYKLNLFHNEDGCDGFKIGKWKHMKRYNWMDLKVHVGPPQFRFKSGWHFSYISPDGGGVLNKYKSYSHWTEFENVNDPNDAIARVLSEHKISLNNKVKIDDSFPIYIRENQEKFKQLILD